MPRPRDYIDEIKKAGAFVIPPKRPVVIVEEHVPPVVETVAVEPVSPGEEVRPEESYALVPGSEPVTVPEPTATPDPEIDALVGKYRDEPTLGDVLDLVVVAWSTHDPTGQSRGGTGLARIPNNTQGDNKRKDGFHFKEADILSYGVETLRPGSQIRARLAEPIWAASRFSLKEIEIYKEDIW
jgi:hypothetical protein